jgi:membrane protein implicated in regulation of membrane protease activity
MVNVEIGWVMIIAGIGLLVAESLHPGFFVAVPGTVLLVMGAVFILLPDIFNQWSPVIMVITGLLASIATIMVYRRIASGHKPLSTSMDTKPLSTSMDTLVGKKGMVVTDVEPGSITGKVKIENQIWSATSATAIPKGKEVEVIHSEGVHVNVTEIIE